MSEFGSQKKGLFNSILNSHYLLPVTAALLILILAAALYNVSEEGGYMREQLRQDFNQQQLILARQAALQIDEGLQDISAEVSRLNPNWCAYNAPPPRTSFCQPHSTSQTRICPTGTV